MDLEFRVRRSRQESGIRERIAEVATRLFCEKGFGQTTVSEIVARAGVTKPVLYYYFGSKAGLFNALFADHFQGIQAIVDRAAALEGPIRDPRVDPGHLAGSGFLHEGRCSLADGSRDGGFDCRLGRRR